MRKAIHTILEQRMTVKDRRSAYVQSAIYTGILREALGSCKKLPVEGETVYFVKCGGFVKIGRATAAGLPDEYEVMASIEGGSKLERDLHRIFKGYRRWREWFRLEGELSRFIGIISKLKFIGSKTGFEATKREFNRVSLRKAG